jgi:all-trans-retinol 13,14-reductase
MDWKEWKPKKQELGTEWDAILIGSGLGALMCAAQLTQAGRRCLVIEQHYVAGGYAHHFPRKKQGSKYLFDVALHQTGSLRNGQFMRRLFDQLGVLDRIDLHEMDYVYRSSFPGLDIKVPRELGEFRRVLVEKFPHEAENLDRYIEIMRAIPGELMKLQTPDGERAKNPMEVAPTAMKYMNKSLDDVFNDTVKDPLLRAVLAQLWPYLGLPPAELSAIYWAQMWSSYHQGGCFYVRGGGQAISNALCEGIEAGGGAIRLRTLVEAILVDEDGRACGVRTKKGEEFRAPVIVSNASTIDTFNRLLPESVVPKDLKQRVNSLPVSTSMVQAYIAIDGDAAALGIAEHEFFVNSGIDFQAEWEAIKRGEMEGLSVLLCNHSSVNSDAAPDGKSVIEAAILAEGDYWLGLPDEEYQAKKAKVTDILIAAVERFIPDVRERIEVIEVGTPKTMYDYSLNPKGAVYGYACGKMTHTIFRPEQKTPIPGLYLAGAWTFPGAGFGGALMSGYTASLKILKDERDRVPAAAAAAVSTPA